MQKPAPNAPLYDLNANDSTEADVSVTPSTSVIVGSNVVEKIS
jgi:hypothetical protein